MAWEVLTCRLPYHSANGLPVVDVLRPSNMLAIVTGKLRPDLTALRPDAPPAIVALVQCAWAAEPSERPSMAEVVRAVAAEAQVLRGARSLSSNAAADAQAAGGGGPSAAGGK